MKLLWNTFQVPVAKFADCPRIINSFSFELQFYFWKCEQFAGSKVWKGRGWGQHQFRSWPWMLDRGDALLINQLISTNWTHVFTGGVDAELVAMLTSMSAAEQKWLMRMLLKDMKFGLGQSRIFYTYHPDAQELYDVSNNLLKVNHICNEYCNLSYMLIL